MGNPRNTSPEAPRYGGPVGGGQMGERVRLYDWKSTPLGSFEAWPKSLQIAVELCLNTKFPIHIWWGPELINIYNDAFIPILGRRHPGALGQPAREIWSEVWSVLQPQVEATFERGESSWNDRRHMVLTRNGFPEEAWFTWAYAPLRDDEGKICGLHCITIEDTPRVLAEKSKERLSDERLRKEADERARTILESIADAFFSLDEDWRFTYANPQSFVVLGRPPDELIGTVLWDEYPGLIGSVFEPIYRGVAKDRKPLSIVAYFPDHKRWYDVRVYPATQGLSVYFRDVSDSKLAEQERDDLLKRERAARSEAERASRIKDEFLATLSHELRTPLNAVLGWCEVLIKGDMTDTEDMASGLRTIERNAHAQAQIISDILDMSGFMAGKVRLSIRPLNLESVIREAIETVTPAAAVKDIKVNLSASFSPSQISGDSDRLQQVFWNLLNNAVKFSHKGGTISITLKCIESHLEAAVADTGIGINPEFLPHVFDRFRQADSSTTRRYGGLGLGLSIVKQLVELHGGLVSVTSEGEGRGSTFTVSLPLTAVQNKAEAPSERRRMPSKDALLEAGSPGANVKGLRVLVVDDEPDARALLKRLLEDKGAVVTTAASAEEGISSLASQEQDLLISDIGMPGEDGFSFIQRVRAISREKGGTIPAIALTAYARSEDRTKAILSGFQMHLSKPVAPSELMAVVGSLAGRLE